MKGFSKKRINEIKDRLAKASRGKWTLGAGLSIDVPYSKDMKKEICEFELSIQGRNDAKFLVNSKADIMFLLEELDRAVQTLEVAGKELESSILGQNINDYLKRYE